MSFKIKRVKNGYGVYPLPLLDCIVGNETLNSEPVTK